MNLFRFVWIFKNRKKSKFFSRADVAADVVGE